MLYYRHDSTDCDLAKSVDYEKFETAQDFEKAKLHATEFAEGPQIWNQITEYDYFRGMACIDDVFQDCPNITGEHLKRAMKISKIPLVIADILRDQQNLFE